MTESPFSILFVCTANICRSAMAEQLLRTKLDADAPVTVSSAGTHALVGHDIESSSAAAIRSLGVDVAAHSARALDTRLVQSSDLVLTATAAHRADAVALMPRAFRRIFTLREFTRLAAGLPSATDLCEPAALRARVADVAGQRGVVDPAPAGADDIGDPFAGGYDVMLTSARLIDRETGRLLTGLGLAGPAAARD